MKTYPPKACTICGKLWQPTNRYQATRNLTCSPECNGRRISQGKKGVKRAPIRTATCQTCGVDFAIPVYRGTRPQKLCSHRCNGKERAKNLILYSDNGKGKKNPAKGSPGAKNPAWKGGVTYWRKKGNYKPIKYVRCPVTFLPMARADGYVMEHRILMAERTRYLLMRAEVVHHLDHNPANNDPGNLELWPTNGSHKAFEHGRIVPGAACRWFPVASALR